MAPTVINKAVPVKGDVTRDIHTPTAARVYTYIKQIYNTNVFNTIFHHVCIMLWLFIVNDAFIFFNQNVPPVTLEWLAVNVAVTIV